MKYKHLFFDLDHTLWDFETNSRHTLDELYHSLSLRDKGINDFDLFHKNYLVHNERLWEKYRKGFIKVDELRWKRFWLTLLDFKIGSEALFPGAIEVLDYLVEKKYDLHLITNGFEQTQHSKLKHSGIDRYFVEVITSEGSNSLKPHKEIFDFALQKAKADASHSIMIGDDPEVDIKGAMNAGIDQVYVNHINRKINFTPTYEVKSLEELKEIF
jgi:putative hydrolase of the HAD superfamily